MYRGVVWSELTQDIECCRVFKKTVKNGLFILVRSNCRKILSYKQNFKFFVETPRRRQWMKKCFCNNVEKLGEEFVRTERHLCAALLKMRVRAYRKIPEYLSRFGRDSQGATFNCNP